MNPRTRVKSVIAALALSSCVLLVHAQESIDSRSTSNTSSQSAHRIYLPYAQFQIPFNVDSSGTPPAAVHLLVSTDEGATWQLHGRATPRDRHFDFRAAAEGDYLFKVQTLDSSGNAFPSPDQPLRVRIDTSKPQASLQADLDHSGNLIVDIKVQDEYLDLATAMIRLRTDRDPQWREVPVTSLSPAGQFYEGQVEILIPQCREVAVVFSISDLAKNSGEANLRFPIPRTALNPTELQLASTESIIEPSSKIDRPAGINIPGAVSWSPQPASTGYTPQTGSPLGPPGSRQPTANTNVRSLNASPTQVGSAATQQGNFPTSPRVIKNNEKTRGPGQLATNSSEMSLDSRIDLEPEELTIPEPVDDASGARSPKSQRRQIDLEPPTQASGNDISENRMELPFYCRSRTFSLDYSVEALGGNALSEVELWGTEDNGRSWQKWGADPDRVSPFDVKVGNDGLFGFRMALVGASGTILGLPKPGDEADAWIHVDSELPNLKITRAVYGLGSEAGMLVIDYNCTDSQLSEDAISLAWSETPDGPWTSIANGLKNTGLYLWKADPGLPNRVFLKLEAVDKAGNIGVHRLELPIDTKGLAPRGRIQGIRPIVTQ